MDYRQNRHYFESIHWVLLAVVSVLTIALLYFFIWVGLLFVLAIGAYLYLKLWNKPTDKQIDVIPEKLIGKIVEKGYDRLDINFKTNPLDDPIVVHGPSLESISYDPIVKKGADGKIRSSNYEITIIYTGKHQFYHYSYRFSLIDNEKHEVLTEYNYQDVVSTSYMTTTRPYYSSNQEIEKFTMVDLFAIEIANGTRLESPVGAINKEREKLDKVKEIFRANR